jgi:hypothetical protein
MLGWFQALMPKEERFFALFEKSAGGTQSTCMNGGGLPNVMGHDRSIEGAAILLGTSSCVNVRS